MLTDKELERLLRYDFSAGTEELQERILRQCLAILDEQEAEAQRQRNVVPFRRAGADDGAELGDNELEMLSAAGEMPSPWNRDGDIE